MIIDQELVINDKNKDKLQKSPYQPGKDTRDILAQIRSDWTDSENIKRRGWREFNDLTLNERMNEDQKSFNNYEPFPSDDPDEAWKSTAVRPIVRNKIISIAAHITGSLLFPKVFAQNEDDQEDQDSALVMRNLMEWVANESDYEKTFLYSVISALVNPAVIIHTEFRNVKRKIKEIQSNGTWKEKEIVDEDLSGFQDTIVPIDELWIENIYENSIQKQGFLIWRKVIDYSLAQIKYGDNENFKKYVRPGIQVFQFRNDDTFYDQFDEVLTTREVEEVIYYNRQLDVQLTIVNGVLLSDPEQPNPRKDKKYPFAKSGYELIDEGKFFYYKSSASKLASDARVVNTLYRMIIDGTYLQLMPPLTISGGEIVNSSIIAPGKITPFESPETTVNAINPNNNLVAGYNALNAVESSVNESSQDPLQSGQPIAGQQTAFEIGRLEQNAKIQLGMFGKMIGFLVKDLGELKMSDIIQFLTIGELQELSSPGDQLKFRSFLIPNKGSESKSGTNKISFTTDISEEPITENENLKRSFGVMDKEGGMDPKMQLAEVNPELFRRIKFMLLVSPDILFPPSDNIKKALMLEEYDRAIKNPISDQKEVYKDLLMGAYEKTKDNPEKYIKKESLVSPEQQIQKGVSGNPLSKILGAESKPKEGAIV